MGVSTNAPMILTIFGFYAVLTVLLGLMGSNALQIDDPPEPSGLTFLAQIDYFVIGIFFSLAELPVWANTILFFPLGITIFYIVLSFFRGSS